MKISKITIKSLFGIKEWSGDGKNIELVGDNGTGKTSVIDAIRYALTNASDREYIIKNGETEGEIFIETDSGLSIDRKPRQGMTDYKSVKQNGNVVPSPETFLKEKDRLRKRQLKQTRIENGLCPRCGKHQSQNGGLCQRCRAYLKNYRDKNRCDLSRSERPDYGICYICGKNSTMKGKKVCDKCYETRLSTLPAMWENANNDYFRQLNYARFCMIKNQRKEKTSGSDFNV